MFKKILDAIGLGSGNKQNDIEDIAVEFGGSAHNDITEAMGPANLVEAFMPLCILLGQPVTVFINEKYDLGEMAELRIQKSNPLMILLIMEKVLLSANCVGTVFVSDGATSHVISPRRVTQIEGYRLYFTDPWGQESFLETGKNLCGVKARKEINDEFSIDYEEYEQVFVAFGFAELDPPALFKALRQAQQDESLK